MGFGDNKLAGDRAGIEALKAALDDRLRNPRYTANGGLQPPSCDVVSGIQEWTQSSGIQAKAEVDHVAVD